jgi:hypothetical protein
MHFAASRMQPQTASFPLGQAFEDLRSTDASLLSPSNFLSVPFYGKTQGISDRVVSGPSPQIPSFATLRSHTSTSTGAGAGALSFSASEVSEFPSRDVTIDAQFVFARQSSAGTGAFGFSASEVSEFPTHGVKIDARPPLFPSDSSFEMHRTSRSLAPAPIQDFTSDDDVDVVSAEVDEAFAWDPFSPELHTWSPDEKNSEKSLMVHFVVGSAPFHSMLPDARLKLFNFIKRALFTHSTDSDRVAVSFWCPYKASAADSDLKVPQFLNFGKHSIVHSFLDDFFSCALEMHSTQLLQSVDFAYHVFHSQRSVTASEGLIDKVRYGSRKKKSQRWKINGLENVYFHRSAPADFLADAEHYCSTMMRESDSSIHHILICMGGDLSSLFAIKSAIEKGLVIFVIAQTGKLANCIAALRKMHDNATQRSEILASLSIILKRSTGHDSGAGLDASNDEIWLHVSIIQSFQCISDLQPFVSTSPSFCSLTAVSPNFSSLPLARRSCSSWSAPWCMCWT